MPVRLFWKLGLIYLALVLVVLLAVDIYAGRVLHSENLQAAHNELAAIENLAAARPPDTTDVVQLKAWTAGMSASGARVTIFNAQDVVLADSAHDAETMENDGDRPEIRQAFSEGVGESVRHSATLDRDLAYRAVRYQPPSGTPVVIRVAVPLGEIDHSLAELRGRLWAASFALLLFGAGMSVLFSRAFASRVGRLKEFSKRVAEGDFRPLAPDGAHDELADLAEALNETTGRLDQSIRALAGERNRSSAILRSMVEAVAVVDDRERLVFSNEAFARVLNLSLANCEGRPLIELVRNPDLLGVIRRALRGEEGLQTEVATGTVQPRSFSVTAAPVRPLEGGPRDSATTEKPAGAVVVLHDVTELRRLERVRQDFVANVSHEFRTPLTAIQGFAETLLSGALEDPQNNRRFVEIIREHATRLARLTEDLLKLSRIEAGKLEVVFGRVGAAELIERCAETALLKASRKQLAVEVDYPPRLPAIRGDAGLLRDVLQNLLDNAIQYTPPGGRIHVGAELRRDEIIIRVTDTGIGIPLADQERIFERFYRVDAARSREAGGTGLGLSIARHIVDAHGGRIWVESQVGKGSKFSFAIPLAR